MERIELNAAEARVLGCLIEKQKTTPETYPLTLNALRLACCQKSNREPVVTMSESDVLQAVDGLIARQLAEEVTPGGSRVPKYRHRLHQLMPLPADRVAILAELLLRGPQTPGQLRSRASRMHPLESLQAVQDALEELAAHPEQTLVMKLPVPPGRKEAQYAQLLTDEPDLEAESVRAAPQGQQEERLEALEAEVASLREELSRLRAEFERARAPAEGMGVTKPPPGIQPTDTPAG